MASGGGKWETSDEIILDVNPITGEKTYFSYDAVTDTTTLRKVGDAEPLIEYNKRMQNAHDASSFGTFLDGRSFYHVGGILEEEMVWLNANKIMTYGGKILDEDRFSKWFMDRDRQKLRTTLKKVM